MGTSCRVDAIPRVVALLVLWLVMAAFTGVGVPRAFAIQQPTTETVTADGVQAVIEEEPFAIRFLDRDGREVLASFANPDADPQVQTPVPGRYPTGAEAPEQPALYAPITFTVGDELVVQDPGTYWAGNLLLGTAAGTQYSLGDVESVERDGRALRLVVATNDPSGRKALVTVAPDDGPMVNVSVRFDDPQGVGTVGASFATAEDESFHGFGGRRNSTDQRGEDFYNWLEEFAQRPDEFEWVSDLPTNGETYQFPTGPQGSYYVQSVFLSSRPYGFWLDRDELSRWRMASDREDAWQVAVAGSELDLVVAPGEAPEALEALTAVTGRNPLPPGWALGPIVSRAVEPHNDTPEAYERKVREDLDAIERLDLPIAAFFFEGWPMLEERGVLAETIARMREMGLMPVTYYKAFVGGGSGQYEREGLLQEAIDGGYVAQTPTGQPYLFGSPLARPDPAALLDFTDPATVEWYRGRIREAFDMGVEGFMQDFGEQTFWDMRFDDGSTGVEMHNRYPVLYHRVTKQLVDEYVAEHPDREPWFHVRSGYSGRPGSAAYELTNWGGDNTADWSRASGIASVIPDMLNRGLGGAYGYTTDIGGYIDTFGQISSELFVRWAQLASLVPVNRLHGGPVNGTHVPWRFDDETVERYRTTIERHIAAQPLIHDLWEEGTRTGMPIARPLWLHFPDDERARGVQQQWLLGPDVLVAPVVEEGATARDVYFPEGCWEHPETGDRFEGPTEVEVDAPIDLLPYYFRCGTAPFDVPQHTAGEADGGADADAASLPSTGGGLSLMALVALTIGVALLVRGRRCGVTD